jgi:uncharacterized protein (TIGR02996 family)
MSAHRGRRSPAARSTDEMRYHRGRRMFEVVATGPGLDGYTTGPGTVVRIGSAPDNALVLRHPGVAPHHAIVVERDGRAVAVDTGASRGGTVVDGRRIEAATPLDDGSVLCIGPFTLRVRREAPTRPSFSLALPRGPDTDGPPSAEPATERFGGSGLLSASDDPAELEFLRAVQDDPDDAAARAVYADWLEERGDEARAEYLRIVSTLDLDTPDHDLLAQMNMQGANLPRSWRAAVAPRAMKIERCPLEDRRRGSDPECPRSWGGLRRQAGVDDLRLCSRCERHVHYVDDLRSARRVRASGSGVVVDLVLPRWQGDLDVEPW